LARISSIIRLLVVWLAKIPSACVFIAFQLARVWRSNPLLTVKVSRLPFSFQAGWSLGETQLSRDQFLLSASDRSPPFTVSVPDRF
jgi:hypothetical protein